MIERYYYFSFLKIFIIASKTPAELFFPLSFLYVKCSQYSRIDRFRFQPLKKKLAQDPDLTVKEKLNPSSRKTGSVHQIQLTHNFFLTQYLLITILIHRIITFYKDLNSRLSD